MVLLLHDIEGPTSAEIAMIPALQIGTVRRYQSLPFIEVGSDANVAQRIQALMTQEYLRLVEKP
jgi:hypothetical protein